MRDPLRTPLARYARPALAPAGSETGFRHHQIEVDVLDWRPEPLHCPEEFVRTEEKLGIDAKVRKPIEVPANPPFGSTQEQ
jgi:hypothetical protein